MVTKASILQRDHGKHFALTKRAPKYMKLKRAADLSTLRVGNFNTGLLRIKKICCFL